MIASSPAMFELAQAPPASGRGKLIAAASLLFALSGWAGWYFVSHRASAEVLPSHSGHDVVLQSEVAADGLAVPTTGSESPATGSPPPAESPKDPAPSLQPPAESSPPQVPPPTPLTPGPRADTPATATNDRPPAVNQPNPVGNPQQSVAVFDPRPAPLEPLTLPTIDEPPARAAEPPAPVREEPVPPAIKPAAAPERPREITQDPGAAIRTTLSRFEAAYSSMNPSAAHAVWPTVNVTALKRAFDGLSSQRVSLGTCDVQIYGATAHATCAGTASFTPKIGGGLHTVARQWTFDLRSEQNGWYIERVQTR